MLHDWASYLIQVDMDAKRLNDKLLHKQYNALQEHVDRIKENLDNIMRWAKEQEEA